MQKYGTIPGNDRLVDSGDPRTREAVANQGYGLDKLIKDEDEYVRVAVARQKYGLDKLISDKSSAVRKEVAYQGYGLEILINDLDYGVRYAVATQGYGLDKLINDQESYVRKAVERYLQEHLHKSILDWVTKNHDKVYDITKVNLKLELKQFFYKFESSSKLEIRVDDSIDDFFGYDYSTDSDEIAICTIDTKKTLFKLQKAQTSDGISFKFIVDITDDDSNFNIKTTISSKTQLVTKLQDTIEFLRSNSEFSKYADDLESCL